MNKEIFMSRKIIPAFFILIYFCLIFSAYAAEEWREEFDYVCGKTDDTMDMKAEELKDLAARCDKLRPIIEGSESPQKKVLLKRLDMCRNLFLYMIEVKEKK